MVTIQKGLLLGISIFVMGTLVGALLFILLSGQLTGASSPIAPSDSIPTSAIEVFDDRIVLLIEGASISSYAPTGSMRPFFDAGANGIRVVPTSPEEIAVGDIISFTRGSDLIVHRVVTKGVDADGAYFITRGDNNTINDELIRFDDIAYKTIGILY